MENSRTGFLACAIKALRFFDGFDGILILRGCRMAESGSGF